MNAERLAQLEEEFCSELVLEELDREKISDERLESAYAVLTDDRGATRDDDVEEAFRILTGAPRDDDGEDPPRVKGEFEEITDDHVAMAVDLFS